MLAIFNSLGGGEVIAILVIALIVLGPEKLPEAIRKFGNIYGELRRMSQGFQSEMREAFDEPLRELRGTAQMMQDAVNNPVRSVTDDLTGTSAPAAPSVEPTPAVPVDAVAPAEEVQAPVEEEPSAPEGPAGPATEPAAVPEADPAVPEPEPAVPLDADDRPPHEPPASNGADATTQPAGEQAG